MLVENKVLFGIFLLTTSALGFFLGAYVVFGFEPQRSLLDCDNMSGSRQVDCVYRLINKELQTKGIESGMDLFALAYNRFVSFSGTGCHRHAHRVGDMVYYENYLQNGGLENIVFSQNTTACGYGFFHGFIEHLVQDRPVPRFVTDTCSYLDEKYGETMGDIRIICYHGSGHGFMLNHIERVSAGEWGKVNSFVEEPITYCEQLPDANHIEMEECFQGIFNILADWMEDEEFGFDYDEYNPFGVCGEVGEKYRHACNYELAQKLGGIVENDPVQVYEVAIRVEDRKFREVVFGVAVAGIIQQTINDGLGYEWVLDRCNDLADDFFEICISSTVNGLFEHGEPQNEYRIPLRLCTENAIVNRGLGLMCHKAISDRLRRFYEPSRIDKICTEFTNESQELCEEHAKK